MPVWTQENVWNRVLLERGTNWLVVWTGLKKDAGCSCTAHEELQIFCEEQEWSWNNILCKQQKQKTQGFKTKEEEEIYIAKNQAYLSFHGRLQRWLGLLSNQETTRLSNLLARCLLQ